jgi:hypothetical protein
LNDSHFKSHSWESHCHPAEQVISRLLRNQKVCNCVHKSQSLDLILSQMNPVHTITSRLRNIHGKVY